MKIESPNAIHKRHIVEFWNKFGGCKNNGAEFDYETKMAAMKTLADVVIPRKCQQSLEYRRTRFHRVKSKRHSLTSFGRCFACGGKAECRHHLIQLQHGGINSKRNLVSLCHACHAEIHPWLLPRKEHEEMAKPITT